MSSQIDSPPMGFIAVELNFHRPPGDAKNERTWPFPLICRTAKESFLSKLVTADEYSDEFIDNFVEAGMWLAEQGCVGILTSCGFLAMMQPILAARLPIPVATSSLLQIPAVRAFLPPSQSIGVITFDSARLGAKHFTQLSISPDNVHIVGCPENGYLRGTLRDGNPYEYSALQRELIDCAVQLVESHGNIGAIVLECTQLPVFAQAIQEKLRLPVYDVYTMGCWFYSGLVRKPFSSWTAQEKADAKEHRPRSQKETAESDITRHP